MAAKKKAKKKQTKSKQATSSKKTPMKKTGKKKLAIKGKTPKKQTKSEQATRNKMAAMKKTGKKKPAIKGKTPKKQSANKGAHKVVIVNSVGKKPKSSRRKPIRSTSLTEETAAFSPTGPEARSGGQAGDLQGLSSVEGADSESVVELLEEGNAFEAAVVSGVENAEGTDPREVRTHEVPEDDVPEEYLDRE